MTAMHWDMLQRVDDNASLSLGCAEGIRCEASADLRCIQFRQIESESILLPIRGQATPVARKGDARRRWRYRQELLHEPIGVGEAFGWDAGR